MANLIIALVTSSDLNQSASFGALTLSGKGGYQIVDGNGDPVTNASDAGTGTASGYSISAGGIITPSSDGGLSAQNGNTIDFSCDQGTGTVTLAIEADTISAASNTEMGQSLATAAAAPGRTIKLRDGNYAGGRLTVTRRWNPANEVRITAYNKNACIWGETWIEESSNLHIDGVTFYVATGSLIVLYHALDNIKIRNCHIYGSTIDTEGDYSVSGPNVAGGIVTNNVGQVQSDIYIENNEIHDVGIGFTGRCQGVLSIQGNMIYNCYEDCLKLNYVSGTASILVKDNYLAGVIASGSNAGNPHPDYIQFIGTGVDWSGIEIDRNIIVHLYDRAAAQGIFMDDMSSGFYYSGVKVRGNLVVQKGGSSTGIRIRQAKNCEVYGNTVVSHLGFAASGPGITVGDGATNGTHIVKNNAADNFVLSGTVTNENNVTLGTGGATVAYSTTFDGPTFAPTTRAAALSAFSMKVGGPLDLAVNVGAIGSGYVTLPSTFPGSDGSLDPSFE